MKKVFEIWTTPLALALTISVVSLSSHAVGAIVTYDVANARVSRTGGPFTVGNQFTVGVTDIVINALGAQDYDTTSGVGANTDGFLGGSVPVGLWDATGSTLLRTATVASADPLIGSYRYASVASFTLLANTTYLIGTVVGTGFENFEDTDFDNDGLGYDDAFAGDGITLDLATFAAAGGTLTAPTNDGASDPPFDTAGRWAPANATFVIPEPSSLTLLGLGAIGLIGVGRRRK